MLNKFKGHDPGMQRLIVFLVLYSFYILFSQLNAIYQILIPLLESSRPPFNPETDPGFFGSDMVEPDFPWQFLISSIIRLLLSAGSLLLTSLGLLNDIRWGWWLAGYLAT
ncbi:MAG: hypothetical protein P8M72_13055 [Gammaproteobacteria bacterium]|nr:hypothetical protein [Gammaproteobacteria bacterium]